MSMAEEWNLSWKILDRTNNQSIPVADIKEFIRSQGEDLKVLFCMNPDVQFCGECWSCKGIDEINRIRAGFKLMEVEKSVSSRD